MSVPAENAVANEPRYLDRELSWLEFNARVLALAENASLPLLERAKFLAIFSSNLDEFFQVRVSGLKDQLAAGIRPTSPDGMDQVEQLRAIRERVEELVTLQAAVFTKEVAPALQEAGVEFVDWQDLDDDARSQLTLEFDDRIFPVLTPLAVDPSHPFPYISSLSLNLAVVVRDASSGEQRFARVKVPPLLPRFVAVPGSSRFVALEQVIAAHLDALFPGMEVLEHYAFRVTRDADFELSDDAEDLLAAMEDVLRQRTKLGVAVRLEVDARMTPEVLQLLCRELELSPGDAYVVDGPLDLSGLMALYALRRPDLKFPVFTPQTPPALAGGDDVDVFRAMRGGDVLVHHPYDSFSTSVEAFVAQAARDPNVLAIKQTLYRTGGDEAGIVASLAKAAETGKQVVALVELKARFEEQTNMERARMLEQAGAHVVYGLVGLKTHAKILLVVRQEPDGIHRYCHVGTGNYNPKTAVLYEDLGVLSDDDELGDDISELFNHLTGYSRPGEYCKLLVAPTHLRDALLKLIRGQARAGGMITMKMNALVDDEIIDELYAASAAGALIDLVVRGTCCLRAGVPGLSERITVRSIVGRYLEHSRIFRFGTPGADDTEYVIGSADMMPRNLDRRVEAMLRVSDHRSRARLDEILELNIADDTLAWSLEPDGTWVKVPNVHGLDAQVALQELATATNEGARLIVAKAAHLRVADVVRVSLATSVARLDANEPALWTERDPEALHQARVATRRLRSDLGTLRDFLDERWARHLRAELRWLGSELGGADAEVMRARLENLHAALLDGANADAARAVIRRLDADVTSARTDLLVALRDPRYAQLHRGLHDAVTNPRLEAAADAPAAEVLPAAVRPTWRRLRRAVEGLGVVPSDAALHAVRIRAKRCRYAAELAAPVVGKRARAFAAALTRVQDVLGEHQDAVVADSWLAKTAPEGSPSEAYALGMLAEIERGLAVRARAGLAGAWDAAAGPPAPHLDLTGVGRTGRDVVRAAGGVVTRTGAGAGLEVLVVHRPRYDDWSLPKGKVEAGERDEETALREVEEETGYRCALGEELPTVRYQDRRGRPKRVRFWHMTVISEAPWVPTEEVDERRWISPSAAATLLSYDADRRLLRSLGGTDALPAAPH